jgi:hypothetical protein
MIQELPSKVDQSIKKDAEHPLPYSQIILLYPYSKVVFLNRRAFRDFSPPANYTDRATAACRRSANFSG